MTITKRVKLNVLAGTYSVCRLGPEELIPTWADGEGFVTISRSQDELSIVCLQSRIPEAIMCDRDWACLKFVGPFAFDETGIVLSVIKPLSESNIGVFVVSTFDGDHMLLKQSDLDKALPLLTAAGHVTTQQE
ncbi:ACT domain-containing protein [Pseudomonas sp. TR47]|uniref:ACT domain-containing protein n=1 Tax=Pseudomonas sp. TR47 TaxID=3342639 RepID=UPI00376FA9E9